MVQHTFAFYPYPKNILLTRCAIMYNSEEIIDSDILMHLYYQLEECAVTLWRHENNCGLDPEWNKELFQHLLMSKAEHTLVDLLRSYTAMEMQNDNTGPCGNENRILIVLS